MLQPPVPVAVQSDVECPAGEVVAGGGDRVGVGAALTGDGGDGSAGEVVAGLGEPAGGVGDRVGSPAVVVGRGRGVRRAGWWTRGQVAGVVVAEVVV